MLKKLIKTSVYMILLSSITMADSLPQVITNLVVAGIAAFAANMFYQLISKINIVFEFVTAHKEKHVAMDEKIDRIEMESKEQYHDLKVQVEKLNEKIDDFMEEMRVKS